MSKHLLTFAIVFSTLFSGICSASVAHGYSHHDVSHTEHEKVTDCEYCQSVEPGEENCCQSHIEDSKQKINLKHSTDPNPDKESSGNPNTTISVPEHVKSEPNFNYSRFKATVPKSISLPKRE